MCMQLMFNFSYIITLHIHAMVYDRYNHKCNNAGFGIPLGTLFSFVALFRSSTCMKTITR